MITWSDICYIFAWSLQHFYINLLNAHESFKGIGVLFWTRVIYSIRWMIYFQIILNSFSTVKIFYEFLIRHKHKWKWNPFLVKVGFPPDWNNLWGPFIWNAFDSLFWWIGLHLLVNSHKPSLNIIRKMINRTENVNLVIKPWMYTNIKLYFHFMFLIFLKIYYFLNLFSGIIKLTFDSFSINKFVAKPFFLNLRIKRFHCFLLQKYSPIPLFLKKYFWEALLEFFCEFSIFPCSAR